MLEAPRHSGSSGIPSCYGSLLNRIECPRMGVIMPLYDNDMSVRSRNSGARTKESWVNRLHKVSGNGFAAWM